MIIIQKEWYSVKQCRDNPRNLYIFGDNTFRKGKAGQAQIRDEVNSFGVCTKWAPNMSEGAFFKDFENCMKIVDRDLDELIKQKDKWDNIVFPYDGLGTGLSDMPNKAPLLYRIMKDKLYLHFGVKYK